MKHDIHQSSDLLYIFELLIREYFHTCANDLRATTGSPFIHFLHQIKPVTFGRFLTRSWFYLFQSGSASTGRPQHEMSGAKKFDSNF